jgi:hypothetical protein
MIRRYWKAHLFVVIVIASVLVALVGYGAKHYSTVKVGGPHGTATVTLQVPSGTLGQAADALVGHRGSRDETPPGAPPAVVNAAQAQDAKLAASDKLPAVFPDAAPEQRGCVTHLVQDYSSRNGVAPRVFVLHYTVSPNVPGWADVNAVVGIFDRWSYQASSNYVIDGEGNCAYIVRETDKAWTQAAANPVAISVEVIATGTEPAYIAPAGLAKLAEVVSDACYRWKIPVTLGAFSGGVLTRPGILDHGMLGVAGGGHHDIAPLIGGRFDTVKGLARTRQVIAAVVAFRKAHPLKPAKPKLTAKQLRAKQRATARKAVLALRLQGQSWQQIFGTAAYKRFVSLGGH